MPVEEIVWRLQNPPIVNDEITALAKELGTLPEELATHLAIPHFMRIQYEFGSVAEFFRAGIYENAGSKCAVPQM